MDCDCAKISQKSRREYNIFETECISRPADTTNEKCAMSRDLGEMSILEGHQSMNRLYMGGKPSMGGTINIWGRTWDDEVVGIESPWNPMCGRPKWQGS